MGIQLILLASLFVAVSNFFMRRSIDAGGSTKAYLMVQFFLICLVAILLNPVRTGNYAWSSSMAAFGFAGGLILALMMAFLGRSLQMGPAGLTFAVLNSSTVMPMVLMVALFGPAFGYIYTLWNGLGSLCVVAGLFWAGWETMRSGDKKSWAIFALGAFALHVLFLVFMQWRALCIHFPTSDSLLLSFGQKDPQNQWFMPMIFLAAALIQTCFYIFTEKRWPLRNEWVYGILGGLTNGIGTYFLIWATEVATPFQHAMLFPLFSVGIILLCSLWGQMLYRENVNWKANAFCVVGLLIGTLDWNTLLKYTHQLK